MPFQIALFFNETLKGVFKGINVGLLGSSRRSSLVALLFFLLRGRAQPRNLSRRSLFLIILMIRSTSVLAVFEDTPSFSAFPAFYGLY